MYSVVTYWYLHCLLVSVLFHAAQEMPRAIDSVPRILAADVKWNGHLGTLQTEGKHSPMVLMAGGFIGWPGLGGPDFPNDMPQRITNWMKAHPKATVISVADLPLAEEPWFRYVWVVDGVHCLNIHLVREGMCSADQMFPMENVVKLIVDRVQYDRFATKVAVAEEEAIDARRGIWKRPVYDARARSKRARNHIAAKRCQEAADALKGADHPDLATPWLRIGACFQEQDEHEKAIDAFNQSSAVAGKPGGGALLGKARSFARLKGIEAAVATMEEEPDIFERYRLLARLYAAEEMFDETATVIQAALAVIDDWPARERRQLQPFASLAFVYVREKMYNEAATVLEKGVVRFIESFQIPFDADYRFQFEPLRLKTIPAYWYTLHKLPHQLSQVSGYFIETGDFDKAYKYASMGLSLRRAILRHLAQMPEWKGDYSPEAVEAGDLYLRLNRAKVFIHRKQFLEAKREIDHAKLLLDLEISGVESTEKTVREAYAQLGQTFPQKTFMIPPKFVWKRPKKPHRPKIDYAGASDNHLILWADEDDPAMSFAALQELLIRDKNGTLPQVALEQAIAGSLIRQANDKRKWQGFSGELLARAAKRAILTAEQLSAYVRNSVKIKDPGVWPASKGISGKIEPNRFSVGISAQVRAGELAVPEKGIQDRFDIVVTVHVRNTRVDGKEVTFFRQGRGRSSRFLLIAPRGIISYSIEVKEPLSRGAHHVSITLDIEVRKATSFQNNHPQADENAPLLASWTVETGADFWAPGPRP